MAAKIARPSKGTMQDNGAAANIGHARFQYKLHHVIRTRRRANLSFRQLVCLAFSIANQCASKHSARKARLNDSTYVLTTHI